MTVPANAGGRRARGPEISRKIFGGVLDYDGAGYYPGLELLNFVFGTDEDELLPTKDPVEFRRRAQGSAAAAIWYGRNG